MSLQNSTSISGQVRPRALVGFRLLLSQILYPYKKALIAYMLGGPNPRYGRVTVGESQFYGGKDFLSMSNNAMTMLSELDGQLYNSLTMLPFTFWEEPIRTTWFKLHCGVGPEYLAWKEKGIILCVVYAHIQYELAYSGRSRHFRKQAVEAIKTNKQFARARAWLEKHDFPPDLTRCFPI
jgi:hypothetical protein